MSSISLSVSDPRGVRDVPIGDGATTIGRNFTNLVVLEEPMSSRFHCVVEKTPRGFRVKDLNSRNGTKVNGAPIKDAELKLGDVITIGKTDLKLISAEAASAPAPKAAPKSAFEAAGHVAHAAASPTPSAPAAPSKPRPPHRSPPPPPQPEIPAESDDGLLDPISIDDLDVFNPPEPAQEASPELAAFDEPEYEPTEVSADLNEWEQTLRARAESLPDNSFVETDIALINARGKTAHAPRANTKAADSSDALTMLRLIMLICFRSRATDIHAEVKNDDVSVRARVDGTMVDVVRCTKELGVKLMSLVKVLSDIDISVRNAVQEGHFSARVPAGSVQAGGGPRRVDYRVSFAPAMFGQKLVIRVLDTANAPLHLSDMHLHARVQEHLAEAIQKESGMILVCGPTGSGKTTTLYAVLRDIDTNERNVVTIEDPVEIQLEGVTQIPVDEKQGNTFAALLRSVLRQDPDAILVGEIRDADTARVAMQAAMTGHLVFSTVHSRDTVGTVYRLIDLGVEPYLVGSGLDTVVAQRLVRLLCPACKKPIAPTPQQLEKLAKHNVATPRHIFKSVGCRRCMGIGFAGRRGIVEMLVCSGELRDVILRSPTVQEIQKHLTRDNFMSMQESGYQLVADGLTSFEEADRAVT